METKHEYLRVPVAADFIGISTSTLYRLVRRRAVPFYQFSPRGIFLDREELAAWTELKRRGPLRSDEAQGRGDA